MKKLELLAPAKNKEIAKEVILHGADAIYIGAPSHGARKEASNSLDDIREVVDFAHQFNVNVYITLNTVIFDNELINVEKLIYQLYRAEVDALIIQDLGILKMDLPPIALHASTQCDIRSVEKARFLKECGFTRLILPREFTFKEINTLHNAIPDISLETFIHGALCVSYSGDCRASAILTGRSANRGECAQICRLPFDLFDKNGKKLVGNKHLLSLKDLSRINEIENLIDAGVTSFKIEGRLKDMNYAKNVVASYRNALDEIIAKRADELHKSSSGKISLNFTPDLSLSFNRGYTSFFGFSANPQKKLASVDTPKWTGQMIGKVLKPIGDKQLKISSNQELSNGDGLCLFDKYGNFEGFRINRIENDVIYLKDPLSFKPQPGTILYRNRNMKWDRQMTGKTAVRQIDISLKLRSIPNGISLEAIDEDGQRVETGIDFSCEQAQSNQEERHKEILKKTGNTIFNVREIDDLIRNIFIPASILTDLRRQVLNELLELRLLNHKTEAPAKKSSGSKIIEHIHLKNIPATENVTNSNSKKFYLESGAEQVDWSIEKILNEDRIIDNSIPLMTSRYCIRRECGKCLKEASGKTWEEPLTLISSLGNSDDKKNPPLQIKFDCEECRMKIYKK